MDSTIKSNLSSFINYDEAIFIQWLSYYQATDRKLEKSEIEFLMPEHQMLRRVTEACERVEKAQSDDEYNRVSDVSAYSKF